MKENINNEGAIWGSLIPVATWHRIPYFFSKKGDNPCLSSWEFSFPSALDLLLSNQGSECFLCEPRTLTWKSGFHSRSQAGQFQGFESFTVSKGRSALYWADLSFLASFCPMQEPQHNSHWGTDNPACCTQSTVWVECQTHVQSQAGWQ